MKNFKDQTSGSGRKTLESRLQKEIHTGNEGLRQEIIMTNRRIDETNRRVDETNRQIAELRESIGMIMKHFNIATPSQSNA